MRYNINNNNYNNENNDNNKNFKCNMIKNNVPLKEERVNSVLKIKYKKKYLDPQFFT